MDGEAIASTGSRGSSERQRAIPPERSPKISDPERVEVAWWTCFDPFRVETPFPHFPGVSASFLGLNPRLPVLVMASPSIQSANEITFQISPTWA
jgi:hypothetical protein